MPAPSSLRPGSCCGAGVWQVQSVPVQLINSATLCSVSPFSFAKRRYFPLQVPQDLLCVLRPDRCCRGVGRGGHTGRRCHLAWQWV